MCLQFLKASRRVEQAFEGVGDVLGKKARPWVFVPFCALPVLSPLGLSVFCLKVSLVPEQWSFSILDDRQF